jgi:ribonucleotide monophosphatase NagD (HAD superfamily)
MTCAGALAQAYAEIGGTVVMAGKPHAPIYDLAYLELAALGLTDRARMVAIGDGIITDVRGANAQHLDCVFIAAGIHGDALMTAGRLDPDKVDAALAAERAQARFTMRSLS